MNAGEWLEARCRQQRLSLRQAGNRTGLSHTTIRDIMKGGRPSPQTVAKLAMAFGGDGENERAALEDELLFLAGWRTRQQPEITQPLAQLMDIAKDFSEPQLRVLSAFAVYLAGVNRDAQLRGKRKRQQRPD